MEACVQTAYTGDFIKIANFFHRKTLSQGEKKKIAAIPGLESWTYRIRSYTLPTGLSGRYCHTFPFYLVGNEKCPRPVTHELCMMET